MPPRDDLALAQDLCARVLHDLGGPLGSVSGALDLLGDEPEAGEVAREAADAMGRRLRLWRAVAGAGAGALTRDGVAALLDGALPGGRARADVSGLAAGAELSAGTARALLAAAMLGAEALPWGGTVHLAGDPAGLAVWPEGRGSAWPAPLVLALAGDVGGGEDEEAGPRGVLAPLLMRLADAAGLRVDLAFGAGSGGGGAAPLTLRAAIAPTASARPTA